MLTLRILFVLCLSQCYSVFGGSHKISGFQLFLFLFVSQFSSLTEVILRSFLSGDIVGPALGCGNQSKAFNEKVIFWPLWVMNSRFKVCQTRTHFVLFSIWRFSVREEKVFLLLNQRDYQTWCCLQAWRLISSLLQWSIEIYTWIFENDIVLSKRLWVCLALFFFCRSKTIYLPNPPI